MHDNSWCTKYFENKDQRIRGVNPSFGKPKEEIANESLKGSTQEDWRNRFQTQLTLWVKIIIWGGLQTHFINFWYPINRFCYEPPIPNTNVWRIWPSKQSPLWQLQLTCIKIWGSFKIGGINLFVVSNFGLWVYWSYHNLWQIRLSQCIYLIIQLMVLTCLLSIYCLNFFDRIYIFFTLTLIIVSIILDFVWLIM